MPSKNKKIIEMLDILEKDGVVKDCNTEIIEYTNNNTSNKEERIIIQFVNEFYHKYGNIMSKLAYE